MNFFKPFFNKLTDKGEDWIIELLKALIIPAPLTLIAVIHSFEKIVIEYPFIIYILFGLPAFLFGLCLYSLIKAKEKNNMLELKNNDLTTYIPMFNVLWDKKAVPYSPCCNKYLSYHFYKSSNNYSLMIVDENYLSCPSCPKTYLLKTIEGKDLVLEEAKKLVISHLCNG